MDEHQEQEVRRRRWPPSRAGRAAAIGGLAAGLAAGGIGIAAAQSDTSSPTTTTAPPAAGTAQAPPGGPMRGPGGFGPHGGFGGPMGAVHGEYVTHFGTGYRTIDVQTGTVSNVSSSSMTVHSDDGSANGFTKTYAVDENTLVNSGRDGIGSVHNGDTVSIEAVVNGNTANAMHIDDRTTNDAIRQHWAPPSA